MPLELFADNASTTVSSGGTTAPAAGTSEAWTVASSSAFPAASNTAVPKTAFRVVDPALPAEWMTVTNVSGATWTVTRGTEGTPVAHAAGFTVQQVVTAGWLNGQDTRLGVANVKQVFDAKGDGRTVQDGAMTSGSATLTSATAGFTAADVGKAILVSSATSTAMRLACRVATYISATSVTLTVPARVTATAQTMTIDGVRTVADAATTNNSVTITSATAAFTAADVGSAIWIETVDRVALNTTISGFTNSTTVTLAANATRTCSAAQIVYGTDDTTAFVNAFTWAGSAAVGTGAALYVPAGLYLVTPSHLGTNAMNIGSNTRVFGDGWDTIIRSTGAEPPASLSRELWGINTGTGGTPDPATNINNVTIENIHFQGTTVEEGFLENGCNLLSLNACSDVTVRNCKFSNCRSDGVYIGSGTDAAVIRHNERVRIEDCMFDGINNQNRNGVSVIDCTDLSINRCVFQNFTNELMPGAIDLEPNTSTGGEGRVRGCRITDCFFTMIGGNTGCIVMWLTIPQTTYIFPFQGVLVANNVIYNVLSSTIGIEMRTPTFCSDTTARNDIIISNNVFRGDTATNTGMGYAMDLEGVRGVEIRGNIWDVSQQSVLIGFNYKCVDITIAGNIFKDLGGVGGKAIEIARCDRLFIDGNLFDHTSPASSGGYIMRFINGGTVLTPSVVTATPFTTGGTLGAATRSYRVSAFMDNNAETVASTAVTAVTTGTTARVDLSWQSVDGCKGYNVYGRTGGSELKMTPTGITTTTFSDTGSVTPSGALPTASSSNGASNGVIFRNNIIRQGSTNNTNNVANVVAGHVNVANANIYQNNIVPSNAALAMGPFIDSTSVYTVSAASLTVDASLVPPFGQIVINTSATANTTLTVANPTIGQQITFRWVITSTSQAYAFAANMKFNVTAGAPAKSTITGRSDLVTFVYDGTNWLEIARTPNVG